MPRCQQWILSNHIKTIGMAIHKEEAHQHSVCGSYARHNISHLLWEDAAHPPFLGNADLHIWDVAVHQRQTVLRRWDALLHDDEQRKIRSYRLPGDKRRAFAARGALRSLLASYLDREAGSIVLTVGQRGKPEIASPPMRTRLEFNMAHSGERVLLAFAKTRRLGVDVEHWRSLDGDNIVRRFFAPAEIQEWAALPLSTHPSAFFDAWTKKEAYLKATGDGLWKALDSFAISIGPHGLPRFLSLVKDEAKSEKWEVLTVPLPGDYSGAVVIERGITRVRYFAFTPEPELS